MSAFRYHAIGAGGDPVGGVIEATDRRAALQLLGSQGLFPSNLEVCDQLAAAPERKGRFRLGRGVKRKEVTALTSELGTLLNAGIPIPQALEGLGEEEENPALRRTILALADSVRKGASFSGALGEHPALFSNLYVNMARVGEEAGALPKVLLDLARLLEHEDEMRSEILSAVAYPAFVLGAGIVTVTVLLGVVLPRLFGMLQEMLTVLPWPTLVLLRVSEVLHRDWIWLALGAAAIGGGIYQWLRTPRGALMFDGLKLKLPLLGPLFRAAALGRFARTLGTLAKSGVSLLPSLKIVEHTAGNLVLSGMIARVAEETRGGTSLADPLRKLGVFPRTVVQMISVGEETGKLDEMLLKVAEIEEQHMRGRARTLISLLAPVLILAVGTLVGFMVIAILLPIFKMSRALH